ncbi:4'-phosphopantetheinyl transferase family protein [Streptomyces spiramenti]|uniref:4'-phosphopantetheinyl transferase superfamily protein n=1 Tax=Streptomyces spiramenti TaxID=2720606 RepID=A0ABX1AKG7_9ACTN|nr:4'-phosphopantetheinyl transferase superfamily protein [Streptomyces spiramenti]NJP66334.1 4'-phosphopantetheinyl transferase superfamily protein [Streptomyces spiramenti]
MSTTLSPVPPSQRPPVEPLGSEPARPALLSPGRGPAPGTAVPAAGCADLWLVDTASHRAVAAAQAPGVLDPQEQARAAEFLHRGDRDGYLASHVALRRLLAGYLGRGPSGIAISRAPCPGCGLPHGRPVVTAEPPLHFSLSHCGELSLLAFAVTPVGVDIEALPGAGTVAEAAEVLHPREAAELAFLGPLERRHAFARVWTRKEAYLKGIGIGLADNPAGHYVGSGPVPARIPGWTVAPVAVPGDHHAAVALRTGPGPV